MNCDFRKVINSKLYSICPAFQLYTTKCCHPHQTYLSLKVEMFYCKTYSNQVGVVQVQCKKSWKSGQVSISNTFKLYLFYIFRLWSGSIDHLCRSGYDADRPASTAVFSTLYADHHLRHCTNTQGVQTYVDRRAGEYTLFVINNHLT